MRIHYDNSIFHPLAKISIPLSIYIYKKPLWHAAYLYLGPLIFSVRKLPDKSKHYTFSIKFDFFMRIAIIKRWEYNPMKENN